MNNLIAIACVGLGLLSVASVTGTGGGTAWNASEKVQLGGMCTVHGECKVKWSKCVNHTCQCKDKHYRLDDRCLKGSADTTYTDCWDLMTRGGFSASGPYTIHPVEGPAASVLVRCDMETDGGGWTVLQRRFDGTLSFTRDMTDYEQGFGDVNGEHWVGLSWMHALTSLQAHDVELRVDLCSFQDVAGFAVYEGFSVSEQSDGYRLSTGTYRDESSLEEMLYYQHGQTFQTTGDCADRFRNGWWYDYCYLVNLNAGMYDDSGDIFYGIMWRNFDQVTWPSPTLRTTEMKIRPVNAAGDAVLHSDTYTCPT